MLVVFEGSDGCGKSSYARRVAEILTNKGKDVILTKVPGGTRLGEKVRNLLFHSDVNTTTMAPGVRTSLFMADFIQAQHEIIKPALDKGAIVIVDRWWYSELMYGDQEAQSIGYYKKILEAYESCELVKPNLIIWTNCDVAVAAARITSRDDSKQNGKAWADRLPEISNKYIEFFKARMFCTWFPLILSYDTTSDPYHTMKLADKMTLDILYWDGRLEG